MPGVDRATAQLYGLRGQTAQLSRMRVACCVGAHTTVACMRDAMHANDEAVRTCFNSPRFRATQCGSDAIDAMNEAS